MTYAIVSFLLGAVLGSRWRAIVLVPASLLIVVAATVAGLSSGEGFGLIALAAIASVVSLQAGYLVGAGIRIVVVGPRAARAPTTAEPALQRAQKLRTEP